MDEACAYAQLQLLHGFCPYSKGDTSYEITPAKLQNNSGTATKKTKKFQKETKFLLFSGKMASKHPIWQLKMCYKGTIEMAFTQLYPSSSQALPKQ